MEGIKKKVLLMSPNISSVQKLTKQIQVQ